MKPTAVLAAVCLVATSAFAGDAAIRRSSKRIPGRYVVVLKADADVAETVSSAQKGTSARIAHSYKHGLKGFALEGTEVDAQKLARDPRVEFVEEDSVVTADVSWALDRIDQNLLPLNGTFATTGTGAGVTAYVVDTGILASHGEFGGRVQAGFTAIADGRGTTDCNGHGTHVAGLIGGATSGVAKSVTLVPVRVLDCNGSGTVSSLLAGLTWALQNSGTSTNRAVVNMSLSGPRSPALDSAVRQLAQYGLTTVAAAGNDNEDACSSSPAGAPLALTVGATTSTDARAPFSNYGKCVDVFAPGVNVISSWYSSPTAFASLSGTSFSAPLAAGVVALYLEKYPTASPVTITQSVITNGTLGVLSQLGDKSPNRMLLSTPGPLDTTVNGVWQLIADSSFDYGITFWASDLCTVLNPGGCPPGLGGLFDMGGLPSRTGKHHASLGGQPVSTSTISEVLTIPATVRRAELKFYLQVITKEKKSRVEDSLKVEIRDQSGKLLETLSTFSNLDASSNYVQRSFDLTRYRGASIRLSFATDQDKGAGTWFLVDDVELNVWK